MLVGNEYLPCLRKVTPQSMSVTKLDLLDLSLIGPSAPGIWAIWSLMLTKKKWNERFANYLNKKPYIKHIKN